VAAYECRLVERFRLAQLTTHDYSAYWVALLDVSVDVGHRVWRLLEAVWEHSPALAHGSPAAVAQAALWAAMCVSEPAPLRQFSDVLLRDIWDAHGRDVLPDGPQHSCQWGCEAEWPKVTP
jgi:hypothetical protein